jgi:hypothetical protein
MAVGDKGWRLGVWDLGLVIGMENTCRDVGRTGGGIGGWRPSARGVWRRGAALVGQRIGEHVVAPRTPPLLLSAPPSLRGPD